MKKLNYLLVVVFSVALLFVNHHENSIVFAEKKDDYIVHYTKKEWIVLHQINKFRKSYGLPPLEMNDSLSSAAEDHGGKSKKPLEDTVEDERTNILPSDNPYEKAILAGYKGNIKEVYYLRNTIGMEWLLESPHGRLIILNPELNEFGIDHTYDEHFNFYNAYTTMYFGYDPTKSTSDYEWKDPLVFPYDGLKFVSSGHRRYLAAFETNKYAYPYVKYNDTSWGYPISFTHKDMSQDGMKVSIKNEEGNDISFYHENRGNMHMFYPKDKLLPGIYTISVDYRVHTNSSYEYEQRNYTWTFELLEPTSGSQNPWDDISLMEKSTDTTSIYADFQEGKYWSEDIKWALKKGLLEGFKNVKNKNGDTVNLLKPNDILTEAQALKILLSYADPEAMAFTTPNTNWWADVAYQLAFERGMHRNYSDIGSSLDDKGSRDSYIDKANANKGMTRLKFAKLLTNIHFGFNDAADEAVKFMFEAGISQGYNGDVNDTSFENFGPDKILRRAHIVTFLKRYDNYLQKNR